VEIGITPSNPEALEDDWVSLGQALIGSNTAYSPPDPGDPGTSSVETTSLRIQRKITSLFEKAENQEENDDWRGAIDTYEDILSLSPDNLDAKILLERARRKAGLPITKSDVDTVVEDLVTFGHGFTGLTIFKSDVETVEPESDEREASEYEDEDEEDRDYEDEDEDWDDENEGDEEEEDRDYEDEDEDWDDENEGDEEEDRERADSYSAVTSPSGGQAASTGCIPKYLLIDAIKVIVHRDPPGLG